MRYAAIAKVALFRAVGLSLYVSMRNGESDTSKIHPVIVSSDLVQLLELSSFETFISNFRFAFLINYLTLPIPTT